MLTGATPEWRGILQIGRYCSLELGCCAALRHTHFTRGYNCLRLWPGNDSRKSCIPLGPKLIGYLRALGTSTNVDAPVFPRAGDTKLADLEQQFRELQKPLLASERNRDFSFSDLYFGFGSLTANP